MAFLSICSVTQKKTLQCLLAGFLKHLALICLSAVYMRNILRFFLELIHNMIFEMNLIVDGEFCFLTHSFSSPLDSLSLIMFSDG